MCLDPEPRVHRILWPLLFVGLLPAPVARAAGAPEELALPGLIEPVEILRDRWGIAHIYARNEHDLFFAQGYNVARDRLFQLELWRRQATGTLAEIQGPRALPRDVGARLLRFRGDMREELSRYHPRGWDIINAFVAGINAHVERAGGKPELLPLEFHVLGITPGRWTPEVVVSRHNGLFRNVTQEVQYAQLVHLLGEDQARELLNLHPGWPRLSADGAIDLALFRDKILASYTASHASVRFFPADVLPAFRSKAAPAEPPREGEAAAPQGSNNWVISGDHTFSRAPILANDPHRTIQLPSLRYWVHLVAPGWNVIGGGEPALPGVSIGHNEHGAWGFTIFPIDQEDLYVYETDPANPSQYRYQGAWEPLEVVRETFAVKGQESAQVALRFTRHGPVLHEDTEHHRAYAVRAAWLAEGAAPYLASLRIDQAASWAEFREACGAFRTPSENLVWADRDGHIGWQTVGLAPIRRNWDGLVPVPGDGRYEWEGFLPAVELPRMADPPRGWVATANQDNLPGNYPHTLGFVWTDSFRYSRIEEVLGSGRRFTPADMVQLQQDELSLPARSLVPMLRHLEPAGPKARQAALRLLAWDHILNKSSVPAAIYITWEKAVRRAVWELLVPREARSVFSVSSLSTERLIQWLTAPDGRFGADPIAGRNALLIKALDQAATELERRLGADLDRWQYGQEALKHVTLEHPLSDAVESGLRARLDLGPLPRGGSAHTVNSTSDSDNQATGASFRLIVDLADWDRALATNTPGQSGDPESPHYRDLFGPWARGEYFPAFYSRAKVESVTETKTLLTPPAASP
jgi:penicillin amidase